ncbi:MAG: hypothetical protein Q8K18_14430 [Burkholderiales bacterium]|nr:hypothetical protein [Burkholderiales bacterium]
MVIYLDQYRKAKTISMAGMHRHAEDRLCVNGNSSISVIAMPRDQEVNELSPQLPDDFSSVDAEAFYSRACALATQI